MRWHEVVLALGQEVRLHDDVIALGRRDARQRGQTAARLEPVQTGDRRASGCALRVGKDRSASGLSRGAGPPREWIDPRAAMRWLL